MMAKPGYRTGTGTGTGTEVEAGVPEKTIPSAMLEPYNGRPPPLTRTRAMRRLMICSFLLVFGRYCQRRPADSAGLELPKHR